MSRMQIAINVAKANGMDPLASANAIAKAFAELDALLLAEEVSSVLG